MGSLDATALCPSLDIPKCAKLAAERMIQNQIKCEWIDIKWATIYIALNRTQDQIYRERMLDIVPFCTNLEGRRPTILTIDQDREKMEMDQITQLLYP